MSVFSNGRGQYNRRHVTEDEGPYVSFADLMFGIIFLFLILIAALLIAQKQPRTQRAQSEKLISEVAALRSQNATLQSQLNEAGSEEVNLSAQLSQAQAALSTAKTNQIHVVYATKLFTFNQFECSASNCASMQYTSTNTLYRTGENAYVSSTLSSAGRWIGTSNPMSQADLDSLKCTHTISHDLVEYDCKSSYFGETILKMTRSGPDTFSGEGTVNKDGQVTTNLIRWDIIEFNDPSFE